MKQLILFVLFTGWLWEVRAQSAQIPKEPTNVQSPNAASLGMYGEVPVSLYTGLPGIEIPLYTAQDGPLTLPIKLDYHASGFRPDMHPGWVGMGWSLDAGGVISRSVRDVPDEDDASSGGYRRGYYYNGGLLNAAGWSDPAYLQKIAKNSFNGGGDTEPDEFSFNFSGYSGKFYLNADGTWKVKCNRPITVASRVPTISSTFQACPIPYPSNSAGAANGAPQTFVGFTITIEDGTQYIFGGPKEANATELQLDIFNEFADYWVASSWYLTQIIHPDGHRITLNYERDSNDYIAQMYVSLQDNIEIRTVSAGNLNTGPNCGNRSTNNISYNYRGKLVSPVYLRSIQTIQSAIYFDRTPSIELPYRESIFSTKATESRRPLFLYLGQNDQQNSSTIPYPACLNNLKWKQLNTIRINSTVGNQPIKNILFSYNDNPNLKERLMLLAVTEQGPDESTKPAYRFGYNKYRNQPPYLAGKNDHWDFYNNNSRYTTVEDYNNANIDYATYYSDRNANPDSAVYLTGMLTRIIYPTGGVTEFLYEQHTYSKQLDETRSAALQSSSGNAGGVRIKKITSYSLDNPQQKLEKEYLYVTGYTPGTNASLPSSGILGGRVRYLFDDYRAKASVAENTVYSKKIFSTQSVLPACSNSQGSHIGYSTVVEKRSDGSYTQYQYSNFDTGNGDEAPLAVLQADIQNSRTVYSPYSSKEEERGKLLQEEQFNKAGQRVKQRLIEYATLGKEKGYVPAMQALSTLVCPDSNPTIEEGTAYKVYTYSYLPTKETETLYDTNGQNPITTVKNTVYSPNTSLGYGLVASESSTDSKNQTVTTTYRYPFDLTFPVTPAPTQLSDPVASAVYAMTAQNMVGLPIETITTRNGLVIGATVQTYRVVDPATKRLLPFQSFRLEAAQPLSQYIPTAYGSQANSPLIIAGGNSQMQLKGTFTQYDASGNPLSLVKGGRMNADYSITGGTISSYLWGYQNTLPVAKVENAAPSEILHSNFEESVGWDAAMTYDNQRARTGLLAGKLTSYNRGDQYHSFGTVPLTIALTAPKKFLFSGWVYSEGPTAQLWLFMYRAGETGYFTYYDYLTIEPTDLNKWVYLEKEIEVPADVVKLNYRLTNFYRSANLTGGRTWFDDVRIHPADAQMTTYTHRPGVGVTSISDVNNRSTHYEYDGLNRLGIVRDQEGNALKQLEYHYQR